MPRDKSEMLASAKGSLIESILSIAKYGGKDKDALMRESYDQFHRHVAKVAASGDDDTDEKSRNMKPRRRGTTGPHDLAASLLEHLRDRLGEMRERRQTTKGALMSREENLRAVAKAAGGAIELCKFIAGENDARGITQDEIVSLLGKHDRRAGESEAACFTRNYGSHIDVRRAVEVTKAVPVVVADPFDVRTFDQDEVAEAIASLQEMGRVRWPEATKDQQFTNAFLDPANAELAKKAHQRPSGHPSYPAG